MPESQAYMDLLAFERKLDATIMRKRLDIQEALKRPMKVHLRCQIIKELKSSSLMKQTKSPRFAQNDEPACITKGLTPERFFRNFSGSEHCVNQAVSHFFVAKEEVEDLPDN